MLQFVTLFVCACVIFWVWVWHKCRPWDPAAGRVIVEEAGGVVLDAPAGGEHKLMAGPGNVLCGHPDACKTVSDIICTAKAAPLLGSEASSSVLGQYGLQIAGVVACAAIFYAFRK